MPEENSTPQPTQIPPTETASTVSMPEHSPKRRGLLKIAFLSICGLGFILGISYIFYIKLADQPLAMVNGVPITQAMVDGNKKIIIDGASEQGVNVEDPETVKLIEQQALMATVQNVLIKTKALEKNITADPSIVQARYDMVQKQISENPDMQARMEAIGLVGENLKARIEEQLITDTFIQSETDIENVTVTEEDMKLVAERIRAQSVPVEPEGLPQGESDGDGVAVNQQPTDADIANQIADNRVQYENQIRIEKQQQIYQAFLAKLEAESTIEIYQK